MDENPPPRPARNTPPDPALRRLLNSWPVETNVSPAFSRAVWRRIEARAAGSRTSRWERWVGWLTRHLERREYALAYLAVVLVAGAAAGALQGQSRSHTETDSLQGRYVASIDPFFAGAMR